MDASRHNEQSLLKAAVLFGGLGAGAKYLIIVPYTLGFLSFTPPGALISMGLLSHVGLYLLTLYALRHKPVLMAAVAVYYALVVGIGMSAGIFASGRVIDAFAKRWKQTYALAPAISLILAAPFYVAFVWAPTWQLALAFLIGPTFLNYFYLSSSVTLVQEEVRPDQRVMSGALLLLVMNFLGLGLGPTYVGMASDYFRASHPDHSLQFALYTLVPFYALAIALFLWLARLLAREQAKEGGAA